MSYQVCQKSHLKYIRTNSPDALSGRISGIPDMTSILFPTIRSWKKLSENLQQGLTTVTELLLVRYNAGLGVGTSLVSSPGVYSPPDGFDLDGFD